MDKIIGEGLTYDDVLLVPAKADLLLRDDASAGSAGYARVTPGSRMGTVRVLAEALRPDATRVTVTYELTALSDAGNETLDRFTPDAFAEMLAEWRLAIDRLLAGEGTAR